ncbi:hypothetical protein ACSTS3_11240 [Aquimarina muelleri]|uniref:hypothetical protein n=1 Tax=Aquimarina muelleri TaxID=279356 RepID=UPI003F684A35
MNFELTGTINFSESYDIKIPKNKSEKIIPDKRYQFVYASQLYGTFFGIFVKFKTSNLDRINKSCTVEAAEFMLVNYSGEINLGIVDIEKDKIEYKNFRVLNMDGTISDLQCLNFDITVKGLEESFKPYPVKVDLQINKEKHKNIYLRVNRKLRPLHHSTSNDGKFPANEPHAVKNQVFDSETYNRSGVFYNQTKKLHKDPKAALIMPTYDEKPAAPWGSCIPGYNKIIFE